MLVLGLSFLIFLVLGLTSLPFWARYNLAEYDAFIPENPKTILVMGGGGFPSEALMMRLWYTKQLALKYPLTNVIITTPGNPSDSLSTIFQMKQYLITNQISSSRILLENKGLNTRHQALLVYDLFKNKQFEEPLVIVSSPSHMYRSIKCFKNVGFTAVSGQPTTSVMLETDLRISGKELGGKLLVPDTGNSISFRYRFWDYLKYEIEVMREYLAITYYKLNGWI
ncbi:MAG: YdcF family protein [Prolixibacteraceae bacterium]|nr:YdcF family protein [Prolixibacteraceae bacterium]